ncbi:hypothetical protein HK100_000721 [Physocladia obscura]|uniref:F-box domain-containing protein n=1 Tax=Physocladia obscura TaxID=109957 RepID=A0AAD5SZH9_9FUNG|nr:hypothetical protein HK100_000721 [Physocladia obscura]
MNGVCNGYYLRFGIVQSRGTPITVVTDAANSTVPLFLKSVDSMDKFTLLPTDIIVLIFKQLMQQSLYRLEAVHPRFTHISRCYLNNSWKRFCFEEAFLELYPDGETYNEGLIVEEPNLPFSATYERLEQDDETDGETVFYDSLEYFWRPIEDLILHNESSLIDLCVEQILEMEPGEIKSSIVNNFIQKIVTEGMIDKVILFEQQSGEITKSKQNLWTWAIEHGQFDMFKFLLDFAPNGGSLSCSLARAFQLKHFDIFDFILALPNSN